MCAGNRARAAAFLLPPSSRAMLQSLERLPHLLSRLKPHSTTQPARRFATGAFPGRPVLPRSEFSRAPAAWPPLAKRVSPVVPPEQDRAARADIAPETVRVN